MGNLRKKRGFTLVEAMISVAILGIVSMGLNGLFRDSMYMWNMGTARLALNGEARLAMTAVRKLIENAQGTSLTISRFNSNQPAFSYLNATLAESMFITTTTTNCGCTNTNEPTTVGETGAPVELYQYNNYLRFVFPVVAPGTDLTNESAVESNTSYKTLTISANVESVVFAFADSNKGTAITAAIRLSKKVWNNKPPVVVFLKENIMVKRMHSAGYYHN
jgi:prepilin-type N-terminal cleavage/methylation domain-containing protein